MRATGATAGMLGVGWRLDGLSEIVRTSRVGGTPRFDGCILGAPGAAGSTSDTFMLDGDEVMRCTAVGVTPSVRGASCEAGGTQEPGAGNRAPLPGCAAAVVWLSHAHLSAQASRLTGPAAVAALDRNIRFGLEPACAFASMPPTGAS